LEYHKIPALFNVIGENIVSNPDIFLKQVSNPLFDFGNHTFHHVELQSDQFETFRNELRLDDEIVKKYLKHVPSVVRPPFGIIDKKLVSSTQRPLVLWSKDTRSWDGSDVSDIMRNVKNITDGDILLMHDNQLADAAALEAIIQYVQNGGFEFVGINELVGANLFNKAKVIYSRNCVVL
jgi:peptidoglycan/xylan/chitin deacetylase (PgdA/CDA1 family)